MKILIEIDCDTITELKQHLECLIHQIEKQAKVNKQNMDDDDFAVGTRLYDDNCYGSHELSVVEND